MRSLTFIAALLLPAMALAAPINCHKASTPGQRTICSDPELIQADARLDTLYQLSTRFVAMGQRDDLLDSQLAWVKQRESCRRDKACIRASYAKRSAVFDQILQRVQSHGPF